MHQLQWVTSTLLGKGATVALIVATLLVGADAGAQNYKASGSGWGHPDANADRDGDGTGSSTWGRGTGTFGQFELISRADLEPWDQSSFCDFDPDGWPQGVLLTYIGAIGMIRVANGDLIHMRMDPTTSWVCWHWLDQTWNLYIEWDVIGGTGKFAGATGRLAGTGRGQDYPDGLSGISFETTGDIQFSP